MEDHSLNELNRTIGRLEQQNIGLQKQVTSMRERHEKSVAEIEASQKEEVAELEKKIEALSKELTVLKSLAGNWKFLFGVVVVIASLITWGVNIWAKSKGLFHIGG